ncbi:MAG: polysaccharide deacetylase family protein [Chitinophagaceae bacterium]|nr:polysaccharide deacetylase family protein [Chitinophagaceae bacterium]
MFYITKTPKWVKKLFVHSIWDMPQAEKAIYLTFDDGPHQQVTPFVLEELGKYNAKATFFCVGKNVVENPLLYNRILEEGHAVGNHTYDHLDGWKTENELYLANIEKAKKYIDSNLFRPPYGRITRNQHKELTGQHVPFKIVMWSVLSGDFDVRITPEQCCKNVLKNTKSGSVVVFHDSDKANERMRFALPVVLKYFSEKGYVFKKITGDA